MFPYITNTPSPLPCQTSPALVPPCPGSSASCRHPWGNHVYLSAVLGLEILLHRQAPQLNIHVCTIRILYDHGGSVGSEDNSGWRGIKELRLVYISLCFFYWKKPVLGEGESRLIDWLLTSLFYVLQLQTNLRLVCY